MDLPQDKAQELQLRQLNPEITVDELIENSDKVRKGIAKSHDEAEKKPKLGWMSLSIPVENSIKHFLDTKKATPEEIINNAKSVHILLHSSVKELITDFLKEKKISGSPSEKELYANMSVEAFIHRLLTTRATMCYLKEDRHILKNGNAGIGGLDKVGAEYGDEVGIENCLTRDETQISAFIANSVMTHFINDGKRRNEAKPGNPGTFELQGVFIGIVGTRLEIKDMEWRFMVITKDQNRPHNGYGLDSHKDHPTRLKNSPFAKFYGQKDNCFPTYNEALQDYNADPENSPYVQVNIDGEICFINKAVYKIRMRAVLENVFHDANERAKTSGKKAFVHLVGAGLGVWAKGMDDTLGALQLEVVAELLEENQYPDISDIHFGHFPAGEQSRKKYTELFDNQNSTGITFSYTYLDKDYKQQPHGKLERLREVSSPVGNGKLLVAAYAWDGNAEPGNEYWMGSLSASGDPAAAACSMIAELQNSAINPKYVNGFNVCWVGNNTPGEAHEQTASKLKPNKPLKALEEKATLNPHLGIILNRVVDLLNRLKGGFSGAYSGDALGSTNEFKEHQYPHKNSILGVEMRGLGMFNLPIGLWTDDFSQMMCLMESLCEVFEENNGSFEGEKAIDALLHKMIRKTCEWYFKGKFSGQSADSENASVGMGSTAVKPVYAFLRNYKDITPDTNMANFLFEGQIVWQKKMILAEDIVKDLSEAERTKLIIQRGLNTDIKREQITEEKLCKYFIKTFSVAQLKEMLGKYLDSNALAALEKEALGVSNNDITILSVKQKKKMFAKALISKLSPEEKNKHIDEALKKLINRNAGYRKDVIDGILARHLAKTRSVDELKARSTKYKNTPDMELEKLALDKVLFQCDGNASIMRNFPCVLFAKDVAMAMELAYYQSLTSTVGRKSADCARFLAFVCFMLAHSPIKDSIERIKWVFSKENIDLFITIANQQKLLTFESRYKEIGVVKLDPDVEFFCNLLNTQEPYFAPEELAKIKNTWNLLFNKQNKPEEEFDPNNLGKYRTVSLLIRMRKIVKKLKAEGGNEQLIQKLNNWFLKCKILPSQYLTNINQNNYGYVGAYTLEGIALAVQIACTAESLEKGIATASEMNGDSDSVAAIVGQILGSAFGCNNIPERWLKYFKELRVNPMYCPEDPSTPESFYNVVFEKLLPMIVKSAVASDSSHVEVTQEDINMIIEQLRVMSGNEIQKPQKAVIHSTEPDKEQNSKREIKCEFVQTSRNVVQIRFFSLKDAETFKAISIFRIGSSFVGVNERDGAQKNYPQPDGFYDENKGTQYHTLRLDFQKYDWVRKQIKKLSPNSEKLPEFGDSKLEGGITSTITLELERPKEQNQPTAAKPEPSSLKPETNPTGMDNKSLQTLPHDEQYKLLASITNWVIKNHPTYCMPALGSFINGHYKADSVDVFLGAFAETVKNCINTMKSDGVPLNDRPIDFDQLVELFSQGQLNDYLPSPDELNKLTNKQVGVLKLDLDTGTIIFPTDEAIAYVSTADTDGNVILTPPLVKPTISYQGHVFEFSQTNNGVVYMLSAENPDAIAAAEAFVKEYGVIPCPDNTRSKVEQSLVTIPQPDLTRFSNRGLIRFHSLEYYKIFSDENSGLGFPPCASIPKETTTYKPVDSASKALSRYGFHRPAPDDSNNLYEVLVQKIFQKQLLCSASLMAFDGCSTSFALMRINMLFISLDKSHTRFIDENPHYDANLQLLKKSYSDILVAFLTKAETRKVDPTYLESILDIARNSSLMEAGRFNGSDVTDILDQHALLLNKAGISRGWTSW